MRAMWTGVLFMGALAISGCEGSTDVDMKGDVDPGVETTPATTPPAPAEEPADPFTPGISEQLPDEHPTLEPHGVAPIQVRPTEEVRVRRRLDIDQLDASIQQVTGGVKWKEGSANLFKRFSITLGKPDYLETTNEDLSPSLIFQKFLGDAARATCHELSQKETERDQSTPPASRHLMIHAGPEDTLESAPEAISRNASALLLRFHGRMVAPEDEDMGHWVGLFDSSMQASQDPVAAWRTVCVALMIHSDFYTY